MGQEERKNKAKLEKTQIQLASNSSEYEAAIKVLEETTGRWNKEWKVACDVSNLYINNQPNFSLTSITEVSRPRGRTARFYEEQPMELREYSFDSVR